MSHICENETDGTAVLVGVEGRSVSGPGAGQ